MKKIILTLCIIYLSSISTIFSQPQITVGTINGVVYDIDTKKAVEYANIVLYRLKDSSIVKGTISNSAGLYELKEINPGRYYISIDFIGYNRQLYNNVIIKPESPSYQIAPIYLSKANIAMEGIEITANSKRIEYQIDKKIINASQEIAASGGSAVNILENSPSVQVDEEGNVSLRGSSSYTVLINGSPTVLTGTEALRQIPANTIDQIEIITNPSVKYDPDGTSGIINIILKKNKMEGLNGMTELSAGTGDKYSGTFSLNYKTNKWNFFTNANYDNQKMWHKVHSNRLLYLGDSISTLDSRIRMDIQRQTSNFKIGTEFSPNDQHTILLSTNIGLSSNERIGISKQTETDFNIKDNYYLSKDYSKTNRNLFEANLNYMFSSTDKTKRLNFNSTFNLEDSKKNNPQTVYNSTSDYSTITNINSAISTIEDETDIELKNKLDYTWNITKNYKLETGIQSMYYGSNELYGLNNYDTAIDQWENNPEYYRTMNYSEHIGSAYALVAGTLPYISFQIGLREEQNTRRISIEGYEQSIDLNRWDLYPSLHLSKELGNWQLQGGYSKRVKRPEGGDLEPDTTYVNKYFRRTGNINLTPEFTSSYEFNIQRTLSNDAFISLESFYRHTVDKIERIQTVLDNGLTIMTNDNIGEDHSIGCELSSNFYLFKKLNIFPSITAFHYRLEGNGKEYTIDASSIDMNARLNISYRITPITRFQFIGGYMGPSITAQGKREAMYMSTFAIRQDLFKRKINISARVVGLLDKNNFGFNSSGENFKSTTRFTRERPIFYVTLSYNFNNYKDRQRNGENGGQERESMGGGESIF